MPIKGKYHPSNMQRVEVAYPKDMFDSTVTAAQTALEKEGVETEFSISVVEEDDMWHIHIKYVKE